MSVLTKYTDTYALILTSLPSVLNDLYPDEIKNKPILLKGRVVPNVHLIISEVLDNIKPDLFTVTNMLSCMLANICYASVKDNNDKSEIFEFFRHIRNAASHSNKFTFLGDEPVRPAKWRNIEITKELQGTQCFGKFIDCADLISLILEIDKIIS